MQPLGVPPKGASRRVAAIPSNPRSAHFARDAIDIETVTKA
jgi:hypothetical protein